MEQHENFLPADHIGQRIADLRNAHKMTREELAKLVGISPSAQGRIENGKIESPKGELLKQYADIFDVSTDFIMGRTDFPGKKNYEIGELGLSIKSAEVLYTRKVDTDVVNRLLEDKGFPVLTQYIQEYFQQTLSTGVRARNDILRRVGGMVRNKYPDKDTSDLDREINVSTIDPFEIDINRIRDHFLAILTRIRKGIHDQVPTSEPAVKETIEIMFRNVDKNIDHASPQEIREMYGVEAMAKLSMFVTTEQYGIELSDENYEEALNYMTGFWGVLARASGQIQEES